MIHLKGTGNLSNTFHLNLVCTFICDCPYDTNPGVNSGLSLTMLPWSSTGGLISYTARRQDIIAYEEFSLKYLPGHILWRTTP